MQYIGVGNTLIAISLFTCLSSGQTVPQFVVDSKPVPFDSKYVVEASSQDKKNIVETARRPLKSAIDQGILRLREVNLKKAYSDFEAVKIYFVHNGATAMGAGSFSSRIGSVYITETNSIYINTSALVENEGRTKKLMTHEFLGALGYDDYNYQITSVLNSKKTLEIAQKLNRSKFNSQNSETKLKSPRIKLYFNQFDPNDKKVASGGVTVVGGGGDEVLSDAKTFLLDYFDTWKSKFSLIKENPEMKRQLEQATSFDTQHLSSADHVFQDYLTFFVQVAFEPMTYQTGLTDAPITSLDQITKAGGVYHNKFNPSYVRLSRDHWNKPIGTLNLTQTRNAISMVLHTQLFASYLELRFPR